MFNTFVQVLNHYCWVLSTMCKTTMARPKRKCGKPMGRAQNCDRSIWSTLLMKIKQ